jgi:transketolase
LHALIDVWQNRRDVGPDLVVLATGSELPLALEAARTIAREDGIAVRVVSMPSWELFEQQDEAYRRSVIPRVPGRVAIEAARPFGWERWVGEDGLVIGMDDFGASGNEKQLAEKFGFTPPKVCARIRGWLRDPRRRAR